MSATAVVLFAHPSEENSRIGQHLAKSVEAVEGVTVRRLYDLYPDFDIDVSAEQAALEAADVVVLQHPFYWYSSPALLKEYLDVVLEHGWAYGTDGTALAGKKLMTVITAGGPENAYHASGYNKFTITELLKPFEATANLCGMTYEVPMVLHGAFQASEDDVAQFAEGYTDRLKALLSR